MDLGQRTWRSWRASPRNVNKTESLFTTPRKGQRWANRPQPPPDWRADMGPICQYNNKHLLWVLRTLPEIDTSEWQVGFHWCVPGCWHCAAESGTSGTTNHNLKRMKPCQLPFCFRVLCPKQKQKFSLFLQLIPGTHSQQGLYGFS